jgi:glycosyltransferase involved in cell wall biosynthesis
MHPKNDPDISIIIGVNGAKTIERCISSILNASEHSPSHELIIVDNGSNDGTQEIIKKYPQVILLSEPSRGVTYAHNKGLEKASGTYIAFTDADCYCDPHWLIEGRNMFEDSSVAIVAGRIEGGEAFNIVQEWMNSRKILDQEWVLRHPYLPSVQTANAWYRKKDILKVNGFDTKLDTNEDADLCWRVLKSHAGRVVFAPKCIIFHHHRDSLPEMLKQSMKRTEGNVVLAKKWPDYPPKNFKASVWKCLQIGKYFGIYAKLLLTRSDDEIQFAKLDFLDRLARKWGAIKGAFKTGQYSPLVITLRF